MLEFKHLGGDVDIIEEFLDKTQMNFCDISKGVKYMWRSTVKVDYAIFNRTLILKETGGNHKDTFYYPIGDDDLGALEEIEKYCKKTNLPLSFGYLDEKRVAFFQARYFKTENRYDRDWCDYLYLAEQFMTYSGKKLSGQRNHVNKFKKNYPHYKFVKITPENQKLAVEFIRENNKKRDGGGKIESLEREHALELSEKMFQLSQRGGYLELDGKVIAVSIGEKVNDTLIIHVEKADTEYVGVYPTLAQEFAKAYATDVKYINREEDCGDLGLRTSKTQYQPVEIKRKNFLTAYTLFDLIDANLEIKTERLTISRIKEADKEAYAKLYTDEELNKFWGYDYKKDLNGELPSPDYFFRFQNSLFEKNEECSFAVRLNNQLIGELVLHNFDYYGGVEMGFRFFKENQSKGFAIESASALKEYLFKKLNISNLKSRCYKQNAPSKKLIEKLGLNKIGEDELCYYFSTKEQQKIVF